MARTKAARDPTRAVLGHRYGVTLTMQFNQRLIPVQVLSTRDFDVGRCSPRSKLPVRALGFREEYQSNFLKTGRFSCRLAFLARQPRPRHRFRLKSLGSVLRDGFFKFVMVLSIYDVNIARLNLNLVENLMTRMNLAAQLRSGLAAAG